jgi:hypothetical protein
MTVILVPTAGTAAAAAWGTAPRTPGAQVTAGAPRPRTAAIPLAFEKTKFVLHAGLAFGAFHRWIWKPYKTGALQRAHGVRKAIIFGKAGLAALFAYHELKLALRAAQGSPFLRKITAPITAAQARLQALGASLRRGKPDQRTIDQANNELGALGKISGQNGAPIKDINPPSNLRPTPY